MKATPLNLDDVLFTLPEEETYQIKHTFNGKVFDTPISFEEMDISDMPKAIFRARLYKVNAGKVLASRTKFVECEFKYGDFRQGGLVGTVFTDCDLTGAKFNGCDLTDARFYNCNMTGTDFTNAKLDGVKIDHRCKVARTVGLDELGYETIFEWR